MQLFGLIAFGDQPGAKFELPDTRVSGTRSPLVSTRTEPIRFASGRPVVLHGMGLAGKVKLPTSSSFRALLSREGLAGVKVRRSSTARGAEKLPPFSSVRSMCIVVTRCGPARVT